MGWIIGRNVRIDTRWATTNACRDSQTRGGIGRARAGRHPGPWRPRPCRPLLQATRTVPIVFPVANDPIGAGYVDSLARPGGNVTGFMLHEYSMSVKWLELLKADRAKRDASGGPSGSRQPRPNRPVWRHSGRSAVAQGRR